MGNLCGKRRGKSCSLSKKQDDNSTRPQSQQEQGYFRSDSAPSDAAPAKKLDPRDFMVSKNQHDLVIREPGTVNGQQFNIEDCEDCDIFICDHSAVIFVDNCNDCRMFIGPIAGSLFVRDCKRCQIIVACQQFRTRDCEDCDFLLFSATRPIIEASTNLRFGCFQYFYFNLKEQFDMAHLSVYENCWSKVHDFTPKPANYSLLPHGTQSRTFLKSLSTVSSIVGAEEESNENLHQQVVPLTYGERSVDAMKQKAMVVFEPGSASIAAQVLDRLRSTMGPSLLVWRTKEVALKSHELERMFQMSKDDSVAQGVMRRAQNSAIIAVSFLSENTGLVSIVRAVCTEISGTPTGCYIPTSGEQTMHMIRYLWEQYEPQM